MTHWYVDVMWLMCDHDSLICRRHVTYVWPWLIDVSGGIWLLWCHITYEKHMSFNSLKWHKWIHICSHLCHDTSENTYEMKWHKWETYEFQRGTSEYTWVVFTCVISSHMSFNESWHKWIHMSRVTHTSYVSNDDDCISHIRCMRLVYSTLPYIFKLICFSRHT